MIDTMSDAQRRRLKHIEINFLIQKDIFILSCAFLILHICKIGQNIIFALTGLSLVASI